MRYLIILGNGFSLDLIKHLGQSDNLPLSNLFEYGDKLPWPGADGRAFISFRNTPNLWILGVRPNNSNDRNKQIIESVITCANTYYLKDGDFSEYGNYENLVKNLSVKSTKKAFKTYFDFKQYIDVALAPAE